MPEEPVVEKTRLESLESQLSELSALLSAGDRRRLHKLLQRQQRGQPIDRGLAGMEAALAQAASTLQSRRAWQPRLQYPEELPVSAAVSDIREAIAANPVVIVAGETGSGKTTQLPKICLDMGYGRSGRIGHTQPRRIATRAAARRLAEETALPLGEAIGWQLRFEDASGPTSLVKVMTDGVLLSEIGRDPDLSSYEVIIIDEAHERSLNIDFLLGHLRRLQQRRPEFRLIVTSATVDTARFSAFFDKAPVLEISGRGYPVELRYLPPPDADMTAGIMTALNALEAAKNPGSVLVFLPTEAAIRDCARVLRDLLSERLDVLPLYARLPLAQQQRIFQSGGRRRVVLATNVAETSLTVPGITAVIDSGLARVARYNPRSKVQRLPVEAISKASARQRSGRCGRIAPGIAIRLYSEEDYESRPEFTEPEIQRSNLASVILQMLATGLGDVNAFPFIDPPDSRLVRDGFKTLEELGALDDGKLNRSGRRLAQLPVDPRIGRILLEAVKLDCLREILVIAASLAVPDPREWPPDKREQARQNHARFRHPDSEFLSDWQLWQHLEEQRQELSNKAFARYCEAAMLSPSRVREWRDVHRQLLRWVRREALTLNRQEASYEAVHRALLSGFLSGIGSHDEGGEYIGAGQRRFRIFPGTLLQNKRPAWLMAAEIIETKRVYARRVAKIEPAWLLEPGAALLKRSWSEPHYQARSGRVMARQTTRLFGLEIELNRRVHYGPLNPVESRLVFIRQAMVERGYRGRCPLYTANVAVLDNLEAMENRSRRRDLVPTDEALFDHYDQGLPAAIVTAAAMEKWWKTAGADERKRCCLDEKELLSVWQNAGVQFPDSIENRGLTLSLRYRFEPGHPEDGVTAIVPLRWLPRLEQEAFEWLVPGMLEQKVTALLKSLPKSRRRSLVPIPDTLRRLMPQLQREGGLLVALERALRSVIGEAPEAAEWKPAELDDWYRLRIEVIDDDGAVCGSARELAVLQKTLGARVSALIQPPVEAVAAMPRGADWCFGELATSEQEQRQGAKATLWPALKDEGDAVSLVKAATEQEAKHEHRFGLARLVLLSCQESVRRWRRQLFSRNDERLLFAELPGSRENWLDSLLMAAAVALADEAGLPRNEAGFAALRRRASADLEGRVDELVTLLGLALKHNQSISRMLRDLDDLSLYDSVRDIRNQQQRLLPADLFLRFPPAVLLRLPVYLEALAYRTDKLRGNGSRERPLLQVLAQLETPVFEALQQADCSTEISAFRWRLEEFRISLFAQHLKTDAPVSEKRLRREWRELMSAQRPVA